MLRSVNATFPNVRLTRNDIQSIWSYLDAPGKPVMRARAAVGVMAEELGWDEAGRRAAAQAYRGSLPNG